MAPSRKSIRPPPRSPLSSEEEAEDALGPPLPPQPHEAEDAPGPPLVGEAEEPAAIEPAGANPAPAEEPPPAVPSELAQVLAALAAQAQQMLGLQAEIQEQKQAAKAAAKAHSEEAHIRASLAQTAAEKGRVLPVGPFIPAGLVADPVSPSKVPVPAGTSRASQVDPASGPAPTTTEKKRAREAFTGGGGAAVPKLYTASGEVDMPPRTMHLKPPTPPAKPRPVTPPLPAEQVNVTNVDSSSEAESCGETPAKASPAPPASPSAIKNLKEVMSKVGQRRGQGKPC